MRTRTAENAARKCRKRTAALAGRPLSAERRSAIAIMAFQHFAASFVNEKLYLGRNQVSRVYRASMDKLADMMDRRDQAALAARTATAGGKLTLPGTPLA